jgi:hypothetical protein
MSSNSEFSRKLDGINDEVKGMEQRLQMHIR